MASYNVLRFAVGSPDDARSHIWRLWIRKDDVYLGARDLLQTMKVSLHASGVWRIAFVEDLESLDKEEDRLVFRWNRPEEFSTGWTKSIDIVVPDLEVAESFEPYTVATERKIIWVPPPGSGRKSNFTILISQPGATEEDLRGVTMASDHLVGHLKKMNGETVWVVLREAELSEEETSTIRQETDDLRINLPAGASEQSVTMARIFRVTWPDAPNAQAQPMIGDIPLTRGHVSVQA